MNDSSGLTGVCVVPTCVSDSVCLVCYSSNGHITAYSLPSLRPLIDYDFLPLTDQSKSAGRRLADIN
uniref:Uncharacterized protein n=1 Tax=Timema shepardi TaxID=629360 RepID=A0A7R9AQY9_TIMSH|nr:unnamed protein product [Timema shepardi]